MPRNLPHFAHCAAPGDSYSMTAGPIVLGIFGSLFFGSWGAGLYWIVLKAFGEAASLGCILGVAFIGTLIAGCAMFKTWYYNARLMCVRHDQCSSGTVVDEPTDSLDGDRKINLLVAPFDVVETEQLMVDTLDSMRGTLTNVPDLIDLQDRQVRFGYVRGLSDTDQQRVYFDLVDNRMFGQPGRGFLRHFYRRDEARMGAAAFAESPDDTALPSNPMFRYDGPVLVPYMHCEVDGNRLAKILDNILIGLVTGLAAFIAACLLCMFVGGADFLCGWVGALLAALLALLAWLIATLVNDPDDGVASGVDVDVEDPDFDTPPTVMRQGDVVFVMGDWIMDEEHGNYFEIHPVKAWYLLCQEGADPDEWVLTEEIPKGECTLDVRRMTEADFERICRIVHAVETTDPDETITIDVRDGLTRMPPRPEP